MRWPALGPSPSRTLASVGCVVIAVSAATWVVALAVGRWSPAPLEAALPGVGPRVELTCVFVGLVAAGLLLPALRCDTRRRTRAQVLGASIVVSGVAFTAAEGRVVTRSFSPERLEVRVDVWWALPLLELPVTPVTSDYVPAPGRAELAQRGVVALPVSRDAARWAFCCGSRCGVRGWRGEAHRLVRELERAAEVDPAGRGWPAVMAAARTGDVGHAVDLLMNGRRARSGRGVDPRRGEVAPTTSVAQ